MAPPKRPWFRLYVELIWDRKVRRLSIEARWLFIAMLACARQSPLPGFLMLDDSTPMNADDLADAASMRSKDVDKAAKDLSNIGLIAFDTDLHAWAIPKWNERQYESDTSTDRTGKHRSKNGDVTPPETEDRDRDSEPPPTPPQGGDERLTPRANGTNPRAAAKRREAASLQEQISSCPDCSDKAWNCARCESKYRQIEELVSA